jgi:hypothetical protein
MIISGFVSFERTRLMRSLRCWGVNVSIAVHYFTRS